ncbi:hypothetical protein FE314_26515 (plasmid) [Priestia megaterium]|nr:hypothetical protein FE314_26515 [Priestia megaterium]KQU14758.1 hypothetical protein ASG61_29785 [Bacillus sp. Leaf75]
MKKTPHVGGSFSSKYQDIALKMILQVSSAVWSKVIEAIQPLHSKFATFYCMSKRKNRLKPAFIAFKAILVN